MNVVLITIDDIPPFVIYYKSRRLRGTEYYLIDKGL